MGLLGRMSLATVFVTVALLGSPAALASIDVSDSGESHDSVWKAPDVGLYLDSSLADLADADEAVGAALAVWETDSRLPRVWPMSGKADSLGYREGETNRNTIRFADSGAPQAKGALAVTLVSYDSEQHTILDGDIVINGIYRFGNLRTDGNSAKYTSGRPVYDLTDVLVHELGHWFGLSDNSEDPEAVMYPYFDPGKHRNLSLGKGDKAALDELYATTSSAPKSPACSVMRPHAASGAGVPFVIVLGLLLTRRRGSKCRRKLP